MGACRINIEGLTPDVRLLRYRCRPSPCLSVRPATYGTLWPRNYYYYYYYYYNYYYYYTSFVVT